MWYPCDGCFGSPRGWDEDDDGCLVGTISVPECGDGCCWNRVQCEDCRGTGLQWIAEGDGAGAWAEARIPGFPKEAEGTSTFPALVEGDEWVDYGTMAQNIVGAFQSGFAGDSLADVLVALDHQLSTDADLDTITGAAKYQALRHAIRMAMAKKLGFSGYRRGR